MASSIEIVGVGARTPVGIQAAAAAAAIRAGIVGLGEHPFMLDCNGLPMPAALDPEIDPTITGPKRLLALAETALREACAPLNDMRQQQLSLPLYLGLPEIRPGFREQDAATVRSGFPRFEGLPIKLSNVSAFTEGHAAALLALARAVEQMRQGACEMCLVGGVDSYSHPDTLEWLEASRQAGVDSRSGFVPGEGAAFCLLMTDKGRQRLGLNDLARVSAVAIGKETKLIKTTDMCLGEGLTATVRDAVSCLRLPDERINEIYCDINGERYRSEEWGFVCLRLSQYFDDPTAYRSPAECWGDMGAASGSLFAMLVCQAFAHGYSKGPRAMVWASSEAGQRGVAVLEASRPGTKQVN